ncbi:THUMP domain-containing class I SAM-dependent RNA methyltransferase [Effusibacillus lacus]|uniref:N-6 DNA methylase n=1 Tax=Effusibacillus lacus TaxID=1348429 RepID=A0A292YIE6_9BACL|nr:class I SAM-dependent RNA methyltransferase [Effusibacillus lacus]TCS74612.1 putative N6-adenine-specific DNA methylase [Effusibacillus lacus]GAX88483.1 N-6 DNA methylase [Effusibacillus lacus]
MSRIELIATAPMGLESVVARELKQLGYEDLTVENGKVTFAADEAAIARCNLWLRSADRVVLKIGEFRATTFEELFEQTKSLPWADWLPEDAVFPVEGRSVKSKLASVPACQSIVKKAVVERLKQSYCVERFEETGPLFAIEVALRNDIATLTIDTSGAGLHKRGYRTLPVEAPIKETLAAGIILLSRWNPDRILADPCCGSGTIPIEAALIGRNIAPGLNREFSSESWPTLSEGIWRQARIEARELAKWDLPLKIYGSDINKSVIPTARFHAKEAGFGDVIEFRAAPAEEFQMDELYGCMITNPPYGERLGERQEVEDLYSDLGYVASLHDTWSFFVLTSHKGFEKLFEKEADKRRKLYNGRIECHLYQYLGPLPPRKKEASDTGDSEA